MHLVHSLALLFILYLELSTCGMKCLSGILEPLCRWFWVPRLCRKWTVAEVDGKCIFDVGLLWDGWLKLWILDARNFIKLFIASACLGAICGWFNIAQWAQFVLPYQHNQVRDFKAMSKQKKVSMALKGSKNVDGLSLYLYVFHSLCWNQGVSSSFCFHHCSG